MSLNKLAIGSLVGLSLLGLPIKANSVKSACQRSNDNIYNLSLETALTLNTINSIIIAKFAPKDSKGKPLELSKLSSRLGYDHFNWVSYVNRDPHGMSDKTGKLLSTPYNDPPLDGYQYEAADKLPFYWDLEKCDRCQKHHHYQHPRITRKFELLFEDFPSDYRLQPGEAVEFVTHLVGVKDYSFQTDRATWDVINTFKWKLTNSSQGRGKVSVVQKNVDLTKLSPFLLAQMQADGGILPDRVYSLVPQLKPIKIEIADGSKVQPQLNCTI